MDIYLATCIPFSVVAVVIETLALRSVSVETCAVARSTTPDNLKISCVCVASSVKAWRCIYRAESKVGLARYVRIVRADIVKVFFFFFYDNLCISQRVHEVARANVKHEPYYTIL